MEQEKPAIQEQRKRFKKELAPSLNPRDVVVMDNLSAHKVVGVKEAIEKVGARLLYL